MTKREYFEAYTRAGLRVIPLLPNSKIPIGKNWGTQWSAERGRNVLERVPDANLGLLLGEIIDVEGDTPEANRRLELLTAGTPHPMYRSAKSVHHLFANPDSALKILVVDGIEFRANGHQSVLPPSNHIDGMEYAWLVGTTFPIPSMPNSLLQYYLERKPAIGRPKVKPGHVRVWCSCCKKASYLHGKRFQAEKMVFSNRGAKWACRQCREVDIRPAARRCRKLLRGK